MFQVSILTEDNRPFEGKGLGRKLLDRLYQTYASDLGGKRFAYDGEKTLYTVGPLPQNRFEFTVVLEESFAKRYFYLSVSYCYVCKFALSIVLVLNFIVLHASVRMGLLLERVQLPRGKDRSALRCQRLLRWRSAMLLKYH